MKKVFFFIYTFFTDNTKLQQQLDKLRIILNSRGYKNNVINEAFNKALQYTQHDILHQEKLNNNTNIPLTFSIPYNKYMTHNGQILRRHWHVIENDRKLKILWPDMPMTSYNLFIYIFIYIYASTVVLMRAHRNFGPGK